MLLSLNDLWKFDPISEKWEQVEPSGQVPSKRSGYAAAKHHHFFVLFGGESDLEVYSDFYRYNTLTNTWEELQISGVSARTRSCMSASETHIFVFGGIKKTRKRSNQLWVIDLKKESVQSFADNRVFSVSSPKCFAEGDSVTLLNGYNEVQGMVSDVWKFNATTEVFSNLLVENRAKYSQIVSSSSIEKVDKDLYYSFGGTYWTETALDYIKTFSAETGVWEVVGNLNVSVFEAASCYFRNSVYIHSGGSAFIHIVRNKVNSDRFYKVSDESWKCSEGTFYNGTCQLCPKGTYNHHLGANHCEECLPGTFSETLGSVHCLPCPKGTFAAEKGSSSCKLCEMWQNCPLGSSYPIESLESSEFTQQQPSNYSPDSAHSVFNREAQIVVISLMIIVLFVGLKSYKIRKLITRFDIYDDRHTTDGPVIIQKSYIGGVFSLVFLVLGLLLAVNTILIYSYENIEELKGLVPMITLKDYEFGASQFSVSVKFYNYPEKCQKDFDVYLESSGFKYEANSLEAKKVNENCIVTFECYNCKVSHNSHLYLRMGNSKCYSPRIEVSVASNSSIPNQTSSTKVVMASESNQVFQGSKPTNATFMLIPSLFNSEVEQTEATGYHVSPSKTSLGSAYDYLNIGIFSTLKVYLFFEQDTTALSTKRKNKQTLNLLISSLLGSIFGLMQAVGIVMQVFEQTSVKAVSFSKTSRSRKALVQNIQKIEQELRDLDSEQSVTFSVPSKNSQVVNYPEQDLTITNA